MATAPEGKIAALALSVALGDSTVRGWAADNKIPASTCYHWAARPAFKARVERIRADMIRQAIGRFAQGTDTASITLLAICANPGAKDADRIAAARAILSGVIELTGHADHKAAMEAINARVNALEAKGKA